MIFITYKSILYFKHIFYDYLKLDNYIFIKYNKYFVKKINLWLEEKDRLVYRLVSIDQSMIYRLSQCELVCLDLFLNWPKII